MAYIYLITLPRTSPAYISWPMEYVAETVDDIIRLRNCAKDDILIQDLTLFIDSKRIEKFFNNTPFITELPPPLKQSSVEGKGLVCRYTNIWSCEYHIHFSQYKVELIYGKSGQGYFRAVKFHFNDLVAIIPERIRKHYTDHQNTYRNLADGYVPGLHRLGIIEVIKNNGIKHANSIGDIKNKINSTVHIIDTYFEDKKAMYTDYLHPRPIDFSVFFAELLGE